MGKQTTKQQGPTGTQARSARKHKWWLWAIIAVCLALIVAMAVSMAGNEDEANEQQLASQEAAADAKALKAAQQYSDKDHMSAYMIREQLVSADGDGFSTDEADYAMKHIKADWNANALASAHKFDKLNLDDEQLMHVLTDPGESGDGFTQAQAQWAISHLRQ